MRVLAPVAWSLVALCWCPLVEADVVPPSPPLECRRGQVVETTHSGRHCEFRRCATDAVCPEGMACVAREETHCDGRDRPCASNTVRRCAKARTAKPTPRCPPGASPMPQRTRAVLAQLRLHEEGKRLTAALGRELVVCYGDVSEGVLQADGALLLQRDRPLSASAARLGHLLHHLVAGLPFDETVVPTSKLTCSELVTSASEAERSAGALENQLRVAFGLPELPPEDLSAAYRARCQALREPSRRSQ